MIHATELTNETKIVRLFLTLTLNRTTMWVTGHLHTEGLELQ